MVNKCLNYLIINTINHMVLKKSPLLLFCWVYNTIIISRNNSNCIIDFASADSIKLAKVSVTLGGGSISKLQIPKRRQRIKGFQSPIKKANFRVTLLYIVCPTYILDLMVCYWNVEWSVQGEAAAANSLSFMIEVS